jgi:hypothetical protein
MRQKERRQAPRTASNIPLDLYDAEGRVIVGEGRFLNLSTIGGQLESPKPLQLDEHLCLRVQSSGRSPLELAGRVIWARKNNSQFTYGIQFDEAAASRSSSH